MVFNATFNIVVVSFIGEGNQSTQRKSLSIPQINDKLYQIMLHPVHLTMSGIQTHYFNGDKY
jgi:hypothetical protein